MSGLVNKIKSFVGLVSGFEDEEDEMFEELQRAGATSDYSTAVKDNLALDTMPSTTTTSNNRSGLKVINHPSFKGHELVILEPRSFEESLAIVNSLRNKKTIVLNLRLLDNEQSQRIVDFLSGATNAIDGNQQKIGEGVFIFTPSNVSISVEAEKSRLIRDAFWNQPIQ